MKNTVIGAFAICMIPGLTFAVTDEQSSLKSALQQLSDFDESRTGVQVQAVGGDPRGVWPAGHPTHAHHKIFSWFDEPFDFYIWREGGFMWAEVIPAGVPFVCSSAFSIVQNGQLFNELKIEQYSGGSLCKDLSAREVFHLTQYTFSPQADLDGFFTLFYDADDVDQINVAAKSTSTSPIPSPQYGTASPELDIYLPTIRYNSPNGLKYIWADLELYGQTTDGDILFRLNGYGVTP